MDIQAIKAELKNLPLKEVLKKTIEQGIYKGISSDCMDGTHIVIGDKDYLWDGRMRTILEEGNYIASREYISIKELDAILEEIRG